VKSVRKGIRPAVFEQPRVQPARFGFSSAFLVHERASKCRNRSERRLKSPRIHNRQMLRVEFLGVLDQPRKPRELISRTLALAAGLPLASYKQHTSSPSIRGFEINALPCRPDRRAVRGAVSSGGRIAGEDRDAVVRSLPVDDGLISHRCQSAMWKLRITAFDLLQSDDRRAAHRQALDEVSEPLR